MAPDSAEQRLHPYSWLFVLVTQLRSSALPLLTLLFLGRGDRFELLAPIAALLMAVYSYVYSRGFRYRLTADELIVRAGIFDRTERHIPFTRVQNIARRSNVLHRSFGVTELVLESGGGARPEAVMKVLSNADADALVAILRGGAQQASRSAEEAGDLLYAVTPSELLKFGIISNRGMVVAAGAVAATTQFSPGSPRAMLQPLFNGVESVAGQVHLSEQSGLATAMGIAVLIGAIVVLLRLLSIILAFLVHHGFRLERHDRRLTTERGLLTRTQGSARADRLQILRIDESLLHRLFGRMSLRTDVAGGAQSAENSSGRLSWLAPIATPHQVDALNAAIHAAPTLAGREWRPVHPRAWKRMARQGALFWLLLGAGLVFWQGWPGLLALLGVVHAVLAARGRARFMGYAMDQRLLSVRDGWPSRHYLQIELDRIQAVALAMSPLDRRAGMAHLRIDAMGVDPFGASFDLDYLPEAEARALFAVLSRRAAGKPLAATRAAAETASAQQPSGVAP